MRCCRLRRSVFELGERQAAHRRAMERHAARIARHGQALGLIHALTALLGALILIAAAML